MACSVRSLCILRGRQNARGIEPYPKIRIVIAEANHAAAIQNEDRWDRQFVFARSLRRIEVDAVGSNRNG
jgi:hypothetical protein